MGYPNNTFFQTDTSRRRRPYLLLHGLTGKPEHLEPLAEALFEAGNDVLVPELSGHTDIMQLRTTTVQHWIADIDRALVTLKEQNADKPIIVGLSLGGLLALEYATEHSSALAGVVVLASPFHFRSFVRELFLGWLSRLPDSLTNRLWLSKKRYPAELEDELEYHSVGAAARMVAMRRRVLKRLNRLELPLWFVQDPLDWHLTEQSALFAGLMAKRAPVEVHYFIGAGHKLIRGPRATEVIERIRSFAQQPF